MILAVRHGERGDRSKDEWERKRVELYYDTHLTDDGMLQAQATGKEIQRKIHEYEDYLVKIGKHSGKKIIPIILSSPFLRTIQTAFHIANNLDNVYENTIFIQEEISELVWSLQEFDLDPMPNLFSKTRKLEDFAKYGLDFKTSKIKLGASLFKSSEFMLPKYPEEITTCQERVAKFCSKVADLFFSNFKYNEYVLIWVSHQYCLGCAIWHLLKLGPSQFSYELIQLCGIVDCRYEDPMKDLNLYKVVQLGTNEHVNK